MLLKLKSKKEKLVEPDYPDQQRFQASSNQAYHPRYPPPAGSGPMQSICLSRRTISTSTLAIKCKKHFLSLSEYPVNKIDLGANPSTNLR